MTPDSFFAINPYHITLTVVGVIVIAARWIPRLVSRSEPAFAPLMIVFGALATLLLPSSLFMPDPRESPVPWELISEMAVIVALFGTGMRIDSVRPWTKWGPTARLLIIAMPLTIGAVALLGTTLAGLTIAGAILLGAVVAPTDPVLAADVQVGPPQEGREHPVRFTLTTEAGLNDGLAFPFVYLGLVVAAEGLNPGAWLIDWLTWDVAYRIVVGTLAGWAGGRALAFVLFSVPKGAPLADTGSGVLALAGVLLCYGSTELIEGYGFIAVAVMGLTLRREEEDHRFHRRLHDFTDAIEHALTAVLLIALGSILPLVFLDLTWAHALIALTLILVIRPLSGWISLLGTDLPRRDKAAIAIFGVRGIGSIYYLCYAMGNIDFVNEDQLWALVGLVILISTFLHGFTVNWMMKQIED